MRFDATAFARHFAASEGWWEALVTLQSSLPVHFATPDLQAGNRIASRDW